jgi:hypothetical protein
MVLNYDRRTYIMAKGKQSSGITKELRAARHKKRLERMPYYARCGYDTRTQYRNAKKRERALAA